MTEERTQPKCQHCGYPVEIGEHAPGCPNRIERANENELQKHEPNLESQAGATPEPAEIREKPVWEIRLEQEKAQLDAMLSDIPGLLKKVEYLYVDYKNEVAQPDYSQASREDVETAMRQYGPTFSELHEKFGYDKPYYRIPLEFSDKLRKMHDKTGDTAFDEIASLWSEYKAMVDQLEGDYRRYYESVSNLEVLRDRYHKLILGESGFNEFSEIKAQLDLKTSQLREIQEKFLSSVRFRREIADLNREIRQLKGFAEGEKYFRIDDKNTLALRAISRRGESVGTAQVLEGDFRIFIGQIGDHYREKAGAVTPPPLESQMGENPVDPEVRKELTNIMVERNVFSKFDRIAGSVDPQDLATAKEAYNEYVKEMESGDLQAQKKYKNKIGQLPKEFSTFAYISHERNMEDFIRAMGPLADFVLNTYPYFRELLAAQKQNELFLSGVENTTIRGPHPGFYNHGDFISTISYSRGGLENVRDQKYSPYFKNVMDNFYYKNWLALKESKVFQEKIGTEGIAEIDDQIKGYLLKNIFNEDQSNDRKVEFKRGLLAFTDPEIAKLNIQFAFTEPGHSGEFPFIDDQAGARNTEIYQYIMRLSDQDIEALKVMNIPGLMGIIEGIKNNPDTFTQPSLPSGAGEDKPNEIYQDIIGNVDDLSLHFLEHGDEQMRIYTAKTLGLGRDNIDGLYPKLSRILEESNGKSGGELQKVIADRIRYRQDIEALRLWLDHTPKQGVQENPYTYLVSSYYKQERSFPALLTMLRTLDAEHGDYEDRFLNGYLQQKTSRLSANEPDEEHASRLDEQGKIRPEYISDIKKVLESFMQQKTVSEENPLFNERVIMLVLQHPEHAGKIIEMGQMGLFDDEKIQEVILNNLEKMVLISPEKRLAYVHVLSEINNSPSQEIQRIKSQLIGQILETDDPVGSYRKINEIFIKNNLPAVGKVYKVFDVLHPQVELNNQINLNQNISPSLRAAGSRRRNYMIYKDLLKVHIDSGNMSLRDYLQALRDAQPILDKLAKGEQGSMSAEESQRTKYTLGKLSTLFENSQLGRSAGASNRTAEDYAEEYQRLRESLGVREGQTVTERISEMFLKPLGLGSINEALDRMKHAKEQADLRGRGLARGAVDGKLAIRTGDLLKGVEDQYIGNIMQNGSVAKEFLGASASFDSTPLDTDVSLVAEEDAAQGNQMALDLSLAKAYGDLIFVVHDQGQFQHTEAGQPVTFDERYELFSANAPSKKHYGIRTGFASTEVQFMIANDPLIQNREKLENIYYEVAKNGFYVPIVDKEGKIIFTENDYNEYRKTFQGLEKFDGPPYHLSPTEKDNLHYQEVHAMLASLRENREMVSQLSGRIRESVKHILAGHGIELKETFDPSLLGAEMYDTGSTGRLTNLPGAYDFDLTVKLDQADFNKAADIIGELQTTLKAERTDVYTKENTHQLRAYGCRAFGNKPIDIDVGIVRKSELAVYGSHDAISDKLKWIHQHTGEEAYDMVVGNILFAKKALKEGQAYKKVEHGGMGGIGVENWVLLHGGNAQEAFQSFYNIANENGVLLPLDEFKKRYKVLDAGINVQTLHHDNYIDKLKPEGYAAMIKVAEKFIGNNSVKQAG